MREHFTNKLPVYILVAVLGGLMSYYYFVFVPQNEEHLVEHANRLLNNKARSVVEKYNGYSNAIATAPKAYFLKWYFDTHPNTDRVYIKESGDTLTYSENSGTGFDLITLDTYHKALVDDKFKPVEVEGISKEDMLYHNTDGDHHFVFEPAGKFKKVNDASAVRPYLSLQITQFTSNLKASDFFDDFFLVSNELVKDKVQEGFVLDSSRLGLLRFPIPDSIKQFGSGAYSKKIVGQYYKAYIKRIRLNRDMEIYVVGVVAESKLHQLGREVPAWFVVFCLLGSLLLIFLYPIIKIFTINRHERLSSTDARLSIYSMILCLSLTTILLVGSYIFIGQDSDRMDADLETFADTIFNDTQKQINALQLALKDSEVLSNDTATKNLEKFREKHPLIINFNEVFSLRMKANGNHRMGSTEKVFVSTPAEFDLETFPVLITNRDYFQSVKMAVDKKRPIDYYLQSINSYTSGLSEAALSIPWQNESVRVITSRLPSVIRAILPAPYKFVVIDRSGEVKFHSEWKELQSENFISECERDVTLSTVLNNNVQDHVSFTYLRNDCRGYFRPLVKDWKLIVYYEVSEPRSLAAEIFSLCLISLALVIICNSLIHFALMQDRKSSGLLKTKTFFYYWLNPMRAEAKQWMYLLVFGLLLLIIELIWLTCFQSITASLLLVFIIITLFYTVMYGNLNSQRVHPGLSESMKVLATLTFIWFIGFVISSILTHRPQHICFIVIASLLVFFLMKFLQRMKHPHWLRGISRYVAYRLFLITALLVIAVAPAWIFISEHYYYSSLARQYSQSFQDIRKVQIKSLHDQPELRGTDYTGHQMALLSTRRRSADYMLYDKKDSNPDFAFYRFLQGFQLTTKSMAELKFDLLPSEERYRLFYTSDKLMAEAPQSLIRDTDEIIVRERNINKLEWKSELTAIFSYLSLALLALIVVLWYLLKDLPRKIFFAPDKVVWDCFPQRKIEKFMEREFENDDETRHPLYGIAPEGKKKLIDDYNAEINKLTSKSIELLIRDRYILKLQELAKNDYSSAWNNCSLEEKYLIYDLAVDGVTNQADQVLIGTMAEKGLIRLTPRLEPVNRSFANFVLNSMNEEELSSWREKEDKEGNWSNLRLILVIIVTTAFVFLSMAEEGFAGRVAAVLASVGLIFPRLITLFSSVGDMFKSKPPT